MRALITGATAGFGEAIAHKFAENNWDLIVTGRREERLNELKAKLEQKGVQVKTLAFDVRDRTQVENALGSLDSDWK